VVALHDLNLVSRYADQVALLFEGQLRAYGEPGAVLDPDLLCQVYRLPLQVLRDTASGKPVILPAVM
jgi:iron complex transport system ATP-binding protein